MARKKLTTQQKIEKEYWRHRRITEQQLQSFKDKGFEVNVELPKVPKRITQGSIRRFDNFKITQGADEYGVITYTGRQTRPQKTKGNTKKVAKEVINPSTTMYDNDKPISVEGVTEVRWSSQDVLTDVENLIRNMPTKTRVYQKGTRSHYTSVDESPFLSTFNYNKDREPQVYNAYLLAHIEEINMYLEFEKSYYEQEELSNKLILGMKILNNNVFPSHEQLEYIADLTDQLTDWSTDL